ncbi:uncharacterized protein VTP21DRAFT_9947 [Calcarisporiella thermophila]|uniref:uncharacterized protein n=1 Tax=Calcarisporiella thermophila TaxID=911321 RepID=UPI00374388CC
MAMIGGNGEGDPLFSERGSSLSPSPPIPAPVFFWFRIGKPDPIIPLLRSQNMVTVTEPYSSHSEYYFTRNAGMLSRSPDEAEDSITKYMEEVKEGLARLSETASRPSASPASSFSSLDSAYTPTTPPRSLQFEGEKIEELEEVPLGVDSAAVRVPLRVDTSVNALKRNKRASFMERARDSSIALVSTLGLTRSRTASPIVEKEEEQEEEKEPLQPLGVSEEDVDWELWGHIVSDYDAIAKRQPAKLAWAYWSGVPPTLRGMAWQVFAKCKDASLEASFAKLLKGRSAYEEAIATDLKHYSRFLREEDHTSAFNVLKAYSLQDEEVGHQQALVFITATLLVNMPEEEAFCLLVRLMANYGLRGWFVAQDLQLTLFQFDRLLEERAPRIHMHLTRNRVLPVHYAAEWFTTLFAQHLRPEARLRLFDVFLAEGIPALFRFALALLQRYELYIVRMEGEELTEFVQRGVFKPLEKDPLHLQYWIELAYATPVSSAHLDKLAKAPPSTEALARENSRLQKMLKDQRSRHGDASRQLMSQKSELDRVREERDELKGKAEQLEDRVKRLEMMLAETRLKYAESESKRESLEDTLADLQHTMKISV